MDVNVTNNPVATIPPVAVDVAVSAQRDSANKASELSGVRSVTHVNEINAADKGDKSEESSQSESVEQMESVVIELSDMMSMLRKGLAFKLDESLGEQVVSVVDIDTGELIRQIPNEEALELAVKLHEKIAEMDGLLMSTQV
ncbi:flagellar protein FlaG [Shewanella sp. MBTL60-007]|uniref:flagellar protein FlaG n=1 Tax=Shewanella sp. MBTL60-007 TaxID=2815911 RepID=UPI001BC4C0D1|nr:flagellar protein FlaG [Shewanella sp. MBTL60-007]GIU20151.1 flagella locus protein FlaG [Shewanella sp. MBTL60-007]